MIFRLIYLGHKLATLKLFDVSSCVGLVMKTMAGFWAKKCKIICQWDLVLQDVGGLSNSRRSSSRGSGFHCHRAGAPSLSTTPSGPLHSALLHGSPCNIPDQIAIGVRKQATGHTTSPHQSLLHKTIDDCMLVPPMVLVWSYHDYHSSNVHAK